jgi:hypothetical protein
MESRPQLWCKLADPEHIPDGPNLVRRYAGTRERSLCAPVEVLQEWHRAMLAPFSSAHRLSAQFVEIADTGTRGGL